MAESVRPSKVVQRGGAGAIIDLRGGKSAIVMSPDYWQSYTVIRERRLAEHLGVDHFREPTTASIMTDDGRQHSGVRIRRFPRLWYCPRCRKLQERDYCEFCSTEDKRVATVPPRVIAACDGGHIEDFPWRAWVGCRDWNHTIELQSGKGESDLIVVCPQCKKNKTPTKDDPEPGTRTLAGALGKLPWKCGHNRPWIGDSAADEPCERNLHGLMRAGSNVYFPLIASSILIPTFSYRIYQSIIFPGDLTTVKNIYDSFNGNPDNPTFVQVLDQIVEKNYKKYYDGDDPEYTKDDFRDAFLNYCSPKRGLGIKEEEWRAFYDPVPPPKRGDEVEFYAERLDISKDIFIKKYFDRIVLIKRLSEVIAQYGFTRIQPPENGMDRSKNDKNSPAIASIREDDDTLWQNIFDEMVNGDGQKRHGHRGLVPLDRGGNPLPRDERNWLPAVKNKGEGIFFVFNRKTLADWQKDDDWKKWEEWVSSINKNGTRTMVPLEDFDLDPVGIMVHTFSHLLMRELARECGYEMAALKERLYVSKGKKMYGSLIYTSTPDSQGSLGGLVAQGSDLRRLSAHLRAMIESAFECSQDPLCGLQNPSMTGRPWGASCHSCMHIPETSCEALMNRFLDRHSVNGEGSDKKGYFE